MNPLMAQLKKSSLHLVASLDGDDLPFLLDQARTEHADIVEIRMDVWGSFFREDMFEKLTRFKQRIGIPMLVSFRGGHPFPSWWQPIHWRALEPASLIDVEWNPKYPWRDIAQQVKKYRLGLMISHHDYQGTPSEKQLIKIAKAAYGKKADIVKIATRAKTEEDIKTLLSIAERFAPKKAMSVMGMGPLGTLSRYIAPLYHSCLVYGYIGTPTASGQLPYNELRDRFRTLYPRYNETYQARLAKPTLV